MVRSGAPDSAQTETVTEANSWQSLEAENEDRRKKKNAFANFAMKLSKAEVRQRKREKANRIQILPILQIRILDTRKVIFFDSIVSRNSGRAKAKNGYCGETARMDT